MHCFSHHYASVLSEAVGADFSDNFDADRFGPIKKTPFSARDFAANFLLTKFGWAHVDAAKQLLNTGLGYSRPYLAELEWLYSKLADDESRDLLVKLTAYRALGHRRIKLPTNTPEFWKVRERANLIPHGEEEMDPEFLGWKLHERSLESFGYPIRMFTGRGACYTTFVHQQYRCETSDGAIECAAGDTAIDAGGCYGDTALYLAHKAGPTGKVASFEFLPFNVSVFRKNLALNPDLADRIRLLESPVYSESGQEMRVVGNGPGTRVEPATTASDGPTVQTLKIDDLIISGNLSQIDFIKMDIEGSELEALQGSLNVLRRFKPKLAITVYHDFKDFWTIPQYLDGLDLGYRFYLRHFTIHAEETVLFARV